MSHMPTLGTKLASIPPKPQKLGAVVRGGPHAHSHLFIYFFEGRVGGCVSPSRNKYVSEIIIFKNLLLIMV